MIGYTDSDWAGSADDMKSTSGYAFSLGSGVFSWASKKQQTVAQSSAEAEYVAASASACQAIWIRRILEDIGQRQKEPTDFFCDNKSAIAILREVHEKAVQEVKRLAEKKIFLIREWYL